MRENTSSKQFRLDIKKYLVGTLQDKDLSDNKGWTVIFKAGREDIHKERPYFTKKTESQTVRLDYEQMRNDRSQVGTHPQRFRTNACKYYLYTKQ